MTAKRSHALLAAAVLAALPAAAAGDPADCGGFSAADAAKLLGAAPGQVKRTVSKVHAHLVMCQYAVGGGAPGLAFSVAVAADAKKAAAELEAYRDNLMVAGETGPWKGRLPKGAYSDISGIGDDAVWTDINGALTVRKGRLTIQFLAPRGKLPQVKAADAVVARF